MSPVQGHDGTGAVPLGQHHIGGIGHTDFLASVLRDDRARPCQLDSAEAGQSGDGRLSIHCAYIADDRELASVFYSVFLGTRKGLPKADEADWPALTKVDGSRQLPRARQVRKPRAGREALRLMTMGPNPCWPPAVEVENSRRVVQVACLGPRLRSTVTRGN